MTSLSLELVNNTLSDYLIATVILVCLIALIKICRRITFNNERKWASKTENIDWLNYQRDHVNLEQSIDAILTAIRIVIWLIGIVFLLDNLGFN